MPPHPEVPAALTKLRDRGFRLFTLTDNLLDVKRASLNMAASWVFFERRFSADGVKHHKPSRQAYAYVERELGVEPSRLCYRVPYLGHSGRCGGRLGAALIRRVGNDVLGVGPQPGIVGDDLNDVVDQLIARHKGAIGAFARGRVLRTARPRGLDRNGLHRSQAKVVAESPSLIRSTEQPRRWSSGTTISTKSSPPPGSVAGVMFETIARGRFEPPCMCRRSVGCRSAPRPVIPDANKVGRIVGFSLLTQIDKLRADTTELPRAQSIVRHRTIQRIARQVAK